MNDHITITLEKNEAKNIKLALDSFVADIVRNSRGDSSSVDFANSFQEVSNKIFEKLIYKNKEESVHTATANTGVVNKMTTKHDVVNVKKSIGRNRSNAKNLILSHYKTFGGSLTAKECAKLTGLTVNTVYTYINEMKRDAKRILSLSDNT